MSSYSEKARETFVNAARTEGIAGAMNLLGYPKSKQTAKDWVDSYGVEITRSALHVRAAEMGAFYTEREKLTLLQDMLDSIYAHIEKIDTGYGVMAPQMVEPQELSRLASAAEKVIKMIELLEGRVTERTEAHQVDSTDLELRRLIADAQNEAAAKEAALKEGSGDDQSGRKSEDLEDAGALPEQDPAARG